MDAIILSIGDELVLGQTVDTNAAWLSGQLALLGISTRFHQTLPDDRDAIARALRVAAQQTKLLIVTGGIGPTDDDLTRQALADAMEAPLVIDSASIVRIQEIFRGHGQEMPQRNAVQALHPAGSCVIANSCGTAPGIRAHLAGATIYVTPGVPREMKVMFERDIEPHLNSSSIIRTATIHSFGAGESTVAEMLKELCDRGRNPTVGTTVANGIVSVRVRSVFDDPKQATDELDKTIVEVLTCLGPIAFGRDDHGLQAATIAVLIDQAMTTTTAESCTGGLLSKLLTDVPGSSAAYVGGWVTYSDQMKMSQLAVPAELIEAHGAVSQPVAHAMAQGARRRSGADFALAITGIAGPDGGTADKPVGTVWLALAGGNGIHCRLLRLGGSRGGIRDRAAKCALQMLRLHLLGQSLDHITWFGRTKGP